jgi:hypothetical protein
VRRALFLFSVILIACSRANAPLATVDAAAIVVASASAAPIPTAPASPSTVPIDVRGYPHAIRQGMNDPASYVGWTKDGALFGWCGVQGGRPTLMC